MVKLDKLTVYTVYRDTKSFNQNLTKNVFFNKQNVIELIMLLNFYKINTSIQIKNLNKCWCYDDLLSLAN